MPIRRIEEEPGWLIRQKPICRSECHDPPSMMYLPPGRYEHTCPACGEATEFFVEGAILSVYPGSTGTE